MIYPSTFETKIGFDQIREKLRQYCLSSLGVDEVESISFKTDYATILRLLKEVDELVQLRAKGDVLPMRNWWNPAEYLKTLAVEGTYWEEEQFYQCRLSVGTYFEAKMYLDKNREAYANLHFQIDQVMLSKKVLDAIDAKIDDTGKVKDNATPELLLIKKQLRSEEGKVRRLTEQLFRSVAAQGFVPEGASPTVREGRLVIPLLAEHKRKIKGFIVDESATGQTIYLEPAEVLEANNEIRDLMHAERREVVKVLKDLTRLLSSHLHDLKSAFEWMGKIDLVNAKSKLATALNAVLPQVFDSPELQWFEARHPLLVFSFKGEKAVVPLNIELREQERFLLVSGP
ncbi:MAG: endonuclease MutS2, partial [Flammeovirgaceae bacterium]